MKQTIILDVDGVLADTMPALNAFYNKKFGTEFRISDYKFYDLEKTWGGTKKRAVRIVDDFFRDSSFRSIPPVEGSREGVRFLERDYALIACTSRPHYVEEQTIDLLTSVHGKGIFSKIIHSGKYTSLASKLGKEEICVREDAGIIIEDCLEVAQNCAREGIEVFLLEYPWNQSNGVGDSDNIKRFSNWNEIILYLEKQRRGLLQ